MANKKVLIVYATRYGSTEEVSQEIGKILEEHDIKANIVNLKGLKSKKWPIIDGYDGLIVGFGIRMNRWTKEPKKFLKKNKEHLDSLNTKLALFVCCATSADADKIPQAKKDYLESTISELNLNPVQVDAFGGIIDFSTASKVGYLNKKFMKMAYQEEAKKEGKEDTMDYKGLNDLRDWEQIKQFAKEYAELIISDD